MLTFYDWDRSPNCLKIKILLTELGIDHDRRTVDQATLQSPAYRAKFPTGMAPAIEDGDLALSESSAIALYVAARHGHGRMIPQDPHARARMYQALSVESSQLSPTMGTEGLVGELAKPEAARSAARLAELHARAQHIARILGQLLGDRAYFAGDYSIADTQLYAATAKSIESGAFVDPPANLVAWHARMTARPAVAQARPHYVHYR